MGVLLFVIQGSSLALRRMAHKSFQKSGCASID
jgi:hypothetical protein